MPIQVTCPSCKSRFQVSDKFAGKQGPCPKCKATINVPKIEAPTGPQEEVKIHAPEEYTSGPRGVTGRPVTKPLARRETRIALVPAVAGAAAALGTLVIVWATRSQIHQFLWLRVAGLLLISPPLVVAGYSFLRNDELEPYRGKWLWLRATVCAVVYVGLWAGLWGVLEYVPRDVTSTAWNWIFVGPPFLVIGAGAAFATLDLDFGSGFFHYCFYLLVTLALGAVAGLDMPWAGVGS